MYIHFLLSADASFIPHLKNLFTTGILSKIKKRLPKIKKRVIDKNAWMW